MILSDGIHECAMLAGCEFRFGGWFHTWTNGVNNQDELDGWHPHKMVHIPSGRISKLNEQHRFYTCLGFAEPLQCGPGRKKSNCRGKIYYLQLTQVDSIGATHLNGLILWTSFSIWCTVGRSWGRSHHPALIMPRSFSRFLSCMSGRTGLINEMDLSGGTSRIRSIISAMNPYKIYSSRNVGSFVLRTYGNPGDIDEQQASAIDDSPTV